MAKAKIDAQKLRQRDAMVLPFKRNIASLSIRLDKWQSSARQGGSLAERTEAQTLARDAIAEVDTQLVKLADVKFPAETQDKAFAGDLETMQANYSRIRQALKAVAG
ncbi:MAG TPA: hypothetical protein VIN06_16575 [Devosia sp.]